MVGLARVRIVRILRGGRRLRMRAPGGGSLSLVVVTHQMTSAYMASTYWPLRDPLVNLMTYFQRLSSGQYNLVGELQLAVKPPV